jgi:threonine/homoserine/homoserine lactone efflux protein
MSNPYWWIWWATIGTTFFARFGISAAVPDRIAAFFLGHIAGDLVWYGPVSIVAHLGRRIITRSVYGILLIVCGTFMVVFAAVLGVSQFLC